MIQMQAIGIPSLDHLAVRIVPDPFAGRVLSRFQVILINVRHPDFLVRRLGAIVHSVKPVPGVACRIIDFPASFNAVYGVPDVFRVTIDTLYGPVFIPVLLSVLTCFPGSPRLIGG